MNDIITREQTLELLQRHVQKDSLLKHSYAVEASMRRLAEAFDGDPDVWGRVGLIHDLDFEEYPEQHCQKTKELLEAEGWPQELIRAVMCHGYGRRTEDEPITDMEKAIYAVDELTGLIMALAAVRPSKSVMDITVKSVKKKWKDKAFAAGVERDIIQDGADRLGLELSDLMQYTIEGMQNVAKEIGFDGSAKN